MISYVMRLFAFYSTCVYTVDIRSTQGSHPQEIGHWTDMIGTGSFSDFFDTFTSLKHKYVIKCG